MRVRMLDKIHRTDDGLVLIFGSVDDPGHAVALCLPTVFDEEMIASLVRQAFAALANGAAEGE